MNDKDYNKTKEELNKEIKKNDDIIEASAERATFAKLSRRESKLAFTLVLSMLTATILFGITAILESEGILSFSTPFAANVFQLCFLCTSLGLGVAAEKMLNGTQKIKQGLKSFSNAKTESEKLEEEIRNIIAMEKARNRNRALERAKRSIELNQEVLNSLSDRYDIKYRNVTESVEDEKNIVNELSKDLEKMTSKLDVLSTQEVLHSNFWKVKTERKLWTMVYGCMGFFCCIPIIFALYGMKTPIDLPRVIALSAAGVISFIGYKIKEDRDYIKVFNKLNAELKEDALSDKMMNENLKLRDKIGEKNDKVKHLLLQLQEHKRALESLSSEESKAMNLVVSKELEPKERLVVDNQEPQLNEQGPSLKLKK